MISRRLIRIKVLQILYAYYSSEQKDLNISEKELRFSINKAYELYHYLLILLSEVRHHAWSRIELARNKRIPTFDDLNPNLKFTINRLIAQIENNIPLKKYIVAHGISWVKYPNLIKELYAKLIDNDHYKSYMSSENSDYHSDKKIVSFFYSDILLDNELFQQVLEEQSIYWNDDLEFIINMVIKTLKHFNEEDGPDKKLLDLFKNKEDKDFMIQLFRKTVGSRTECSGLIESTADNWDLERIAVMDILIMQLAITEFLYFETIPTKVTMNEYLEIAKYYSTEKSNSFINGVLDKILMKLRNESKIKKTGRGLIGEN